MNAARWIRLPLFLPLLSAVLLWCLLAALSAGAAVLGSPQEEVDRQILRPRDEDVSYEDSGWLGVYVQELTGFLASALDLESQEGVLVSDVVADSPAEEAGLEAEDLILEIDGESVDGPPALVAAIRSHAPGERVTLTILRAGERHTLTAELERRPHADLLPALPALPELPTLPKLPHLPQLRPLPQPPGSCAPSPLPGKSDGRGPRALHREFLTGAGPRLGVQVMPLEEGLARYFHTEPGSGLLVLKVERGSAAEDAGVEPGDVLLRVGDQRVTESGDVRAALRAADDEKISLEILRDGERQTLDARVERTRDASRRALRDYYRDEGRRRSEDRLRTLRERVRRGTRGAQSGLQSLREELEVLRQELEHLRQRLAEEIGRAAEDD